MQKIILLVVFFITLFSSFAYSATVFTPRLTLTEEYSDNLDLSPDNERSDWFTIISPGANLDVRGRIAGLVLDYEPSYVMYNRYSDDNTWRHRASANFWANLTRRTLFTLEDEAVYTEEPYSEFDTTRRQGRNHYFINTATTNLHYQFGAYDSVDLGYIFEFLNNEDDDHVDTQRHEPYAVLRYWPQPNEWGTETSLRYRKGLYDVEDQVSGDTENWLPEDFDFYTANFRLIKQFSPRLNGSIRYGYSNMDYDGTMGGYSSHEAGPGFTYAVGENTNLSAELVYIYRDRNRENYSDQQGFIFFSELLQSWIFSRSHIDLSARSGYQPDTFGAENLGFNLYAEAEAVYEYSFSRQTAWDLFGGARYDSYIDLDPERVDNIFRAGTGLSYQALSWARFRVEYSYRQVLSDSYEYEYVENRGLISLTLMPLSPSQPPRDRMRERRRGRMEEEDAAAQEEEPEME